MNQPQIPSSAPLEVARHYQRLLGLPAPWMVTGLVENIAEARIDIQLHHTPNAKFPCPHCQALCPVRDHAPARRWRHLDALQYATFLTARSPRVKCEKHGVCGVSLPWADFSARWTIDLECKAIDTMHACASLSAAAKLLNLSWDMLQSIMSSAVERGLERRSLHGLCLLGLDEKSFLRGQSYISVCNDLVGRRVLEVSPGRAAEEAAVALRVVPEAQRGQIEAVALDMSMACANAVKLVFPKAAQVIDRFHVSQLLNKMVHNVRRSEHARLMSEGDDILKGTARLWLWGPENMSSAMLERFSAVAELNLQTSKAWLVKENFASFWDQPNAQRALAYFEQWEAAALKLKFTGVTSLVKTLRRHLQGLLAYQTYRITNALSEGFNSKIQALKAAARGFRNPANYRIRILFFCGKLDMTRTLTASGT